IRSSCRVPELSDRPALRTLVAPVMATMPLSLSNRHGFAVSRTDATARPCPRRRLPPPCRSNGGSMRIEILCTGDEVLTGKIVNTNFSYMAQKLEDVGLSVHWGTTVGDDRETLLAAFRLAADRADAVIVNGGAGPPVGDPSQASAAQAGRGERV